MLNHKTMELTLNLSGFILIFLMFAYSITSLCFTDIDRLQGTDLSNSAMLALAIIVCFIMYSSIGIDKSAEKVQHIFMVIVFVTAAGVFCAYLAWANNGNNGSDLLETCGRMGMLIFSYLFTYTFWKYVLTDLDIELTGRIRLIQDILYVILLVSIASALLNPVFHHIFEITSDGEYVRRSFVVLSFVPMVVTGFTDLLTALYFTKGTHSRRAEAVFVMLPFVCLIAEYFMPDYALFYISLFITLMLFYGNFYVYNGRDMAKKDKELSEQKFASMYSQIQPHFLYNSLTSIMNLPGTSPEIKDAISDFGKYLRGNLDSINRKHPIQIGMELNHVETYVQLEKLRFKEKLNVEFDIRDRMYFIPALCLQMMVENAIRHGVTMKEEGGTVWISSIDDGTSHVLTIRDDGVGFDTKAEGTDEADEESHFGIINTRNLLKKVNGTLEITSEVGVGTTAVIRIPKKH